MKNQVIRRGKFDSAHRLLNSASKCRNLHGHEYHYELVFSWREAQASGFAIDFSDLKRMACAWFDRAFDHAFIANACDRSFLELCHNEGLRSYQMNLCGAGGFCNPTAENIAKEMFYACQTLLSSENLEISNIRLQETSNCFVVCSGLSDLESRTLRGSRLDEELRAFRMDQMDTFHL